MGYKANITDLEKEVWKEKGYKELNEKIKSIEAVAAGTPTANVLDEYKENLELKSSYEYTAAFLNGLKEGFNLAFFLKPDPERLYAKCKRGSSPLISA